MPDTQSHTYELFRQCNACVLVPTYNNAGTLAQVIDGVLAYTDRVIVIVDGATDNTSDILKRYPTLHIISYTPNRGKGIALRTGIKEAAKLGYDYAISIDSDGQHQPADLPKFLEKIQEAPGSLIIGARNMNQAHIPAKSSFGNKFSSFWFWVETGNRQPDTQSGYRLYPVQRLSRMHFVTRKFEFEIEVIVRAAWSGVPVISIPVSVYYPPAGERVSHFRPFRDFTRISVLNTILVLVLLLYIKPRDVIRLIFSRHGWQKIWQAIFVNPQESNHLKAASIAFGIFMGIVPVWGFQLLIGIPLALVFRLNKALFLLAANISIFPFTAFILLGSIITGKWLLHSNTILPDWHHITFASVKHEGAAFFLGGTVLAIASSISAYILTLGILAVTRRRKSGK